MISTSIAALSRDHAAVSRRALPSKVRVVIRRHVAWPSDPMAELRRVEVWKAHAAESPGKVSPWVREDALPRVAPFVDPVVTARVVESSPAREDTPQAFHG